MPGLHRLIAPTSGSAPKLMARIKPKRITVPND